MSSQKRISTGVRGWGWGKEWEIRVGAGLVYSRSTLKLTKPNNSTLQSNNVRMDEFIDPGLQRFTRQATDKNGERNTHNTVRIISTGITRFLEKTDSLGKKIAQDLHIDFLSSKYKYNRTVDI